MADSIPNIYLLQEKSFKKELRSHGGNHGLLITGNINSAAIENLCVVLEASNIHILKYDDYFELIFYTGCPKVVTLNLIDFVSGYLTKLDEPMAMDGIEGFLVATQKGRVRYEVINDDDGLSILEFEGYFCPDIKVQPFYPTSIHPRTSIVRRDLHPHLGWVRPHSEKRRLYLHWVSSSNHTPSHTRFL